MSISNRSTVNQINWNHVYYFSEIAGSGSIKDAAEKLKLTASTLSLHLAQLEEDLKVQLFYRQHRKLALTPEGTRLYLQAKTMFEAGQRLIDAVSPVPLGRYPVSVAIVPSSSVHTANRFLAKYLRNRGLANMKILRADYSDLEKGLAETRFDFGFTDRVPERRDIMHRKVSQSVIKFYVSSQWARTPFPELIHKLPLLICSADPKQRSLAEQTLIETDLLPSSVVTSDYHSTILDLCHQGAGIGVLSESAVREASAQGAVSLTPLRDAPVLADKLYVVWAEGAENTESIKALHETVTED